MHRLIVALLSALDALIQVAAGLAVIAAPLTALWVFGFGTSADWSALWPATAAVWHVGNLVPLHITLPDALIAAGISADAASFVFSLAPLAFGAFTVIFGVRSGTRAARSGAWVTGGVSALFVATGLSTLIALTSQSEIVATELWQAIVIPAALYGAAVFAGGFVSAWRGGDDGVIDRLRGAFSRRGALDAVDATALGAAVCLAALIGLGAVAVAVAVALSVGEIVALYQAGNVDILGAVTVTLGQLAYIPTLIVWAIAWIAGPGFAVGTGSTISPVGTDLAVVPSIPVFAALPETSDAWFLLVALLPVSVGALGGWVARSRLHRTSAFGDDAMLPRVATTLGIAVLAALGVAAMTFAASGAMGPGRLVDVGPQPGATALAIGVEVLIGASILLLSPLSRSQDRSEFASDRVSDPRSDGRPPVRSSNEPSARAGDYATTPLDPFADHSDDSLDER